MRRLPPLLSLGAGLNRPECVLAHSSGYLIASDQTGAGGISIISPDGNVRRVLAKDAGVRLKPNGIALAPDGTVLLAHLGADRGGVYRLDAGGNVEPVATEVEGIPLPPTNFVMLDEMGRTWITVSTRKRPRQLDYRPDAHDGFIVLLDSRGPRIVAERLGYANECALSPNGDRLAVAETFGRQVSEFSVRGDGTLSDRRILAEFGTGTFADGLAFDSEESLWVTSIVSNRLIRIAADGAKDTILEDCDSDLLALVEAAFQACSMNGDHLNGVADRTLGNLSSLAFGGEDLKTIYLGTLMGQDIKYFRSEVAGCRPVHWEFDIEALCSVE